MSEVGWDTSYSIEIKDISATTAYHIAEAFKKYLGGLNGDKDAMSAMAQVVDVCDTINRIDDED